MKASSIVSGSKPSRRPLAGCALGVKLSRQRSTGTMVDRGRSPKRLEPSKETLGSIEVVDAVYC